MFLESAHTCDVTCDMVASRHLRTTDLVRETQALRTLAGVLDRKARTLQAALNDGLSAENHERVTTAIAQHEAERLDLLAGADRLEATARAAAKPQHHQRSLGRQGAILLP